MKKLKLQNQSYKALLQSFTEWLDILGYSEGTVYLVPIKEIKWSLIGAEKEKLI